MISLDELVSQYPSHFQSFRRRILAEYLQCKILQIVFNSKFAGKLSFLGGTALRIVHDITRFSEDLDSECEKLDFKALAADVQPLLFNPADSGKLLLFKKYFEGLEL